MKDIIIEGVDRLGKDSLIQGIQDELGFFQVVHYQKPNPLAIYYQQALQRIIADDPNAGMDLPGVDWDCNQHALKRYQRESFTHMFRLLSQPGRHIMNRAHLGECVYAPRYRGYGGDYVFDLERTFTNDCGSMFTETTLLVLLTTSDFSFIKDDGLSFDFGKKEEEQEDFKRAFVKSTIKKKLMIDVSHGGAYRKKEDILAAVIAAYR